MELIERDNFIAVLDEHFKQTSAGEGHCFFITGEAGIGKTSLVKTFLKQVKDKSIEYTGTCDPLFTPRPLAPLYDLSLQMKVDWAEKIQSISSRSVLFTKFLQALSGKYLPVVIVFEDIHWADEATLDFVKFFSRRIGQTNCLFILTYRDNDVGGQHPLSNMLGDLIAGTFTHLSLTPLSKQAVKKLSDEKGFDGEDVFTVSGGNPFYVNEILASYSAGVPDNIKNTVLSVFNSQDAKTKNLWELLSVMPEGLEIQQLKFIDEGLQQVIENSLEKKFLTLTNNTIFFKHELYRRAIEASLSTFKRIKLNKYLLDLFIKHFEEEGEIERIVHYAKNCNDNKTVVKYAPVAAKKAASVGAHIEAAKLFLTAIDFSNSKDEGLVKLYEDYAYECYLTNQVKTAIVYVNKALEIWKYKNDIEQMGNSLRFLSRLWWYNGNRQHAEENGWKAIEMMDKQPSSRVKAMVYSNMSQLKMLSDEVSECILWGDKAIAIARELNDDETLSHAMNNVGTVQMTHNVDSQKGQSLLQQSLEIAIKNSYHEHAARAYTNLGSISLVLRDYPFAKKILTEGIKYCEDRDLDSWTAYMSFQKARLLLNTGHWKEAYSIADHLIKNKNQAPVVKIGALIIVAVINFRRGDGDILPLLFEAKSSAAVTMEMQRIVPALTALLEYEWLSGKLYIENELLDKMVGLIKKSAHTYMENEFAFWLLKARKQRLQLKKVYPGYQLDNITMIHKAAALWKNIGCSYEQALALFEGTENDKRKALLMLQELEATAVYKKLKMAMRSSGITKIPRGLRESTRSNPAQLTNRELDILQLLKTGNQNKEIAEALFLATKTVDHHISSIFFKLGVNSRNKAVAEANRLGL